MMIDDVTEGLTNEEAIEVYKESFDIDELKNSITEAQAATFSLNVGGLGITLSPSHESRP